MNKVLVIGSGGAGKSTFARRLSSILNIEVVHPSVKNACGSGADIC